MKIVGFITDYPVVRKILKHLDLWDRSPPPDSVKSPADEEMVCEPYDNGWLGNKSSRLMPGLLTY